MTTRATTAATRLTTDSRASDSMPTDPVRKYAPVFMLMVTSAAAIDSQRVCSGAVSASLVELPSIVMLGS